MSLCRTERNTESLKKRNTSFWQIMEGSFTHVQDLSVWEVSKHAYSLMGFEIRASLRFGKAEEGSVRQEGLRNLQGYRPTAHPNAQRGKLEERISFAVGHSLYIGRIM